MKHAYFADEQLPESYYNELESVLNRSDRMSFSKFFEFESSFFHKWREKRKGSGSCLGARQQ